METFIRQGAILLLIFASCCFADPVRSNHQRALTDPDEIELTGTTEVVSPAGIKDNLLQQEYEQKDRRNEAFSALEKSAERWLHVRELTGNNDHPMITGAMNLCGLDGYKGYAWCAAAQAEIFYVAEIEAPRSARVVDWFNENSWQMKHGKIPVGIKPEGMVGGLYYSNLGRLGHIFLIVGEDKNNFFTMEGNTNIAGSREGDGFYKKVRPKSTVAALADYIPYE